MQERLAQMFLNFEKRFGKMSPLTWMNLMTCQKQLQVLSNRQNCFQNVNEQLGNLDKQIRTLTG